MSQKQKPSVYLTEKCGSLEKVLDWLISAQLSRKIDDKLISFLSQIDFWDWEIENLIFSFDNFKERSKAWEYSDTTHDLLSRFGIAADAYKTGNNSAIAPVDKLNNVLLKWNKLLEICEKRVMLPAKKIDQYIKLGAQILPNLDKYKKKKWAQ